MSRPNCNIQTSITVPQQASSVNLVNAPATPGYTPLFTPETPMGTRFSKRFLVPPGQSVLVEAYNLQDDMPIWVNRLIIMSQNHNTGTMCPPCGISPLSPDEAQAFRSRLTMGMGEQTWSLINYSGANRPYSRLQILIQLPGWYDLELSNTNMLGTLQVYYSMWDNSLTPNLPVYYYTGVENEHTPPISVEARAYND